MPSIEQTTMDPVDPNLEQPVAHLTPEQEIHLADHRRRVAENLGKMPFVIADGVLVRSDQVQEARDAGQEVNGPIIPHNYV